MDEWVSRLMEVTGATPAEAVIRWEDFEERLGVTLPGDFKELCGTFGVGEFSEYVTVLSASTATYPNISDWWARSLERLDSMPEIFASMYESYSIFRSATGGLLRWGASDEAEFYWLVKSAEPPSNWKIVARDSPVDPWLEYEMGVPQFLFRLLSDDSFLPLSIASLRRPTFVPLEILE